MINIVTYLQIDTSFNITGKSIFTGLNKGKDMFTYNSKYELKANGTIISKHIINDIYTSIEVLHNTSITFDYRGNISIPKNTSQTKRDGYLEVDSIYSAFMPYLSSYSSYNIELLIKVPSNYKVAGYEYKDGYYYKKELNIPCISFVMFRDDLMNIIEGNKVSIYAYKYHDIEEVKKMANVCNYIFNRYEQLFTSCNQDHLYIILNPRFENGAYARNNIIYLIDRVEGLNKDTLMHIAHEISHLWWKNAIDFNNSNWLNESFAQYSALTIVKEIYGKEVYLDYIKDLSEYINLGSLESVDDNTPSDIRFNIQYYKGPYLLYLLEQEIGNIKMIELMKECYYKKIKSSKEFLELCPIFNKYYRQ